MGKIAIQVHGSGTVIFFRGKRYRCPFKVEFSSGNKEIENFKNFIRQRGLSCTETLLEGNKIEVKKAPEIKNDDKNIKFVCKKDPVDKRDYLFKSSVKVLPKTKLPDIIDYTKEMTPVKDQGGLGSCTGFAVCAMKEWKESKDYLNEVKTKHIYRRKDDAQNLSEQWAYYKAKEIDPWPYEEGSSLRYVLKQVVKLGITPERKWKYNDLVEGNPLPQALAMAKWAKGKSYNRITSINEMITALYKTGPIVAGIECFNGIFDVGDDGVVPMPSLYEESMGGHAICICSVNSTKKQFKFKNSWGCYDKETEVLTQNGFKLFKDLNENDILATLNNNKIEYNKPIDKFEYDYNGEMYHYCNKKIDLLVTPNHNMYIQSLSDRQKKKDNFRFVKAEDIKYKQIVMKRDGEWEGEEKEYFELPSIIQKTNGNCGIKEQPTKYIKMDDWLEFFGYWISEGSTSKCKCKAGGYQYGISISQSKKENISKIDDCLKRLGYTYHHNEKGFSISNFQLYNYLIQFKKCNEKFIPKEIKNLSRRQLIILYDSLMLGDGSRIKGKNGSYKVSYYTSSEVLRDDFQEICLKIGYCTSYTNDDRRGRIMKNGSHINYISYHICINNTQSFDLGKPIIFQKHIDKKLYNGKIYCVEVPNHILFIRRNGKTCWCGNSSWGQNGYGYLSFNYIKNYMIDCWTLLDI
jgi:hypothetical protein